MKRTLFVLGLILLVVAAAHSVSASRNIQPAGSYAPLQSTVSGGSLQGSSPSLQPAAVKLQGGL